MDKLKVVGILLVTLAGCLQLSCKKDTPSEAVTPPPPPPYVRTIDLAVADTGLAYAYLRVRFLDTAQTRAFRLHRDGQPVVTVPTAPLDTTLAQDSLALHRTYTYRAYRLCDTLVIDSSLSVTLTTPDTTSHDFVFQTFQLGEAFSSVFSDVAIIDENNVWAVGEVYMRDSTGQEDPDAYNLARWDGIQWRLTRLQFPSFCGQPGTAPHPGRAVIAFSANDVWIADVASFARWNGTTFTILCIPPEILPGSINKMWGENSSSVYVVGNLGTIVHYNGSGWQGITSGTTLPIYDVFGVKDVRTGQYEILCVASNLLLNMGRKILKIQGSTVTEMPDTGLPWSIHQIWLVPGRKYIVAGDGTWQVNHLGETWNMIGGLPNLSTGSVRGTGLNDVVIGGGFWNLLHFNGSTYRSYFPRTSGSFTSVAMKGNLVVAVGGAGGRAIAVIGRR
jgi:hypothetical protein